MVSTAPVSAAALLPERPELSPARRRLFETALELFSRDGYNGVSVRDIARELGQQPTAIYAHVSSKQDLLFQLIRISYEELRDRLRAALLDAGRDPVDQVRAIVTAHVIAHVEHRELARVNHNEYDKLSPEQQQVLDSLRNESMGLLSDVVHRGIELGAFHPIDTEIALRGIGAMGVRTADWYSHDSGKTPKYVADTHATLAIRMLT